MKHYYKSSKLPIRIELLKKEAEIHLSSDAELLFMDSLALPYS